MSNEKAFPINTNEPYNEGMNLRDYFAAKAMQSLITLYRGDEHIITANEAYRFADQMMKERG